MKKEERQIIRDLLILLRQMPQSVTFEDVPQIISKNFQNEIDKIHTALEEIEAKEVNN